jgi:hypothetical protein
MDYDAWSSVWKTDGFLAVCCRITGASGLEYIFARKCPLPSNGPTGDRFAEHWRPNGLLETKSGGRATASGCVSCGPAVVMGAICA